MVADWKEDQITARKLLILHAPGGIRTPNPQIRSLVLCPIELRAHTIQGASSRKTQFEFRTSYGKANGGERGI